MEEIKSSFSPEDKAFMQMAFSLAERAAEEDEVPIGAVLVHKGEVIARAYNRREQNKCATHHAEILAIEEGCRVLGGWRLPDCTLYVTMEPCAMCAGAIMNARIDRVVFGIPDIRFGAFGSLFDLSALPTNHTPTVEGGLMREECLALLRAYFKQKRKN
jgi:tRNA(adenine34) deaminase